MFPFKPLQKSIRDFFRAPPPPPSAEREAKRQRTIGSYFEKSPAGVAGGEGPGCAVPTPAQRAEAGSSTAKRPSCSQWGLPGRTANPKPSCARRISLGNGVHALAAHRREVSIREASNEAPSSADAGTASVSLEHSELAPAGPAEHQQGNGAQQAQPAEQGPSLLRRMLSAVFNQQLPTQAVIPQAAASAAAVSARMPSLLCHSQLEGTGAAAQGLSGPVTGRAEGVSRILARNRTPYLSEYDQATVQSPPDDAADQHVRPAPSTGPSRVSYAGPEESMGDNGNSQNTFGAGSTAADASRAPADSQKENAQARRAQLGMSAGEQQLSPGKGPRQFGTELGVHATDYGLPSSTVRGDSHIVSSDLS